MSRAFFDDPENRVVLQICRTSPGFIPIVLGGKLHPVREVNLEMYPVSADLSAEDCVIGLEVLGCRLVRTDIDAVEVRAPTLFKNELWETRAHEIQAVLQAGCEGRRTGISDYLHARG